MSLETWELASYIARLPQLLRGEDPSFVRYFERLAEASATAPASAP